MMLQHLASLNLLLTSATLLRPFFWWSIVTRTSSVTFLEVNPLLFLLLSTSPFLSSASISPTSLYSIVPLSVCPAYSLFMYRDVRSDSFCSGMRPLFPQISTIHCLPLLFIIYLFFFIVFYFVLFCFVLFCFVLFCFVLFCSILFCY